MILNDNQKIVHKNFRSYLKESEGHKGQYLSNLINAAEQYLPALIKSTFCVDIECLYDNKFSIEDLVIWIHLIKHNDSILISNQGYICLKSLEAYTRFLAIEQNIDISSINIEELIKSLKESDEQYKEETYPEGEETDAVSRRYERSKKAKEQCIKFHGCKCYVCGMDFEKVYGELGKGFIEVHHRIPISLRGGAYKINPKQDLVPICSNCHSMVHRKKRLPLDVDVLKDIYQRNNKNT